jgi:hypothetical protein
VLLSSRLTLNQPETTYPCSKPNKSGLVVRFAPRPVGAAEAKDLADQLGDYNLMR